MACYCCKTDNPTQCFECYPGYVPVDEFTCAAGPGTPCSFSATGCAYLCRNDYCCAKDTSAQCADCRSFNGQCQRMQAGSGGFCSVDADCVSRKCRGSRCCADAVHQQCGVCAATGACESCLNGLELQGNKCGVPLGGRCSTDGDCLASVASAPPALCAAPSQVVPYAHRAPACARHADKALQHRWLPAVATALLCPSQCPSRVWGIWVPLARLGPSVPPLRVGPTARARYRSPRP